MTTLSYAYLCEDAAISITLKNLLPQFVQHYGIELECKEQSIPIKAGNNTDVNEKLIDAATFAFRNPSIDVFFAGRDLDNRKPCTDYDVEFTSLYSYMLKMITDKLPSHIHNKIIIFIPVQCVEHWLLYLQQHKDDPRSNKNIEFEKDYPRHKAKKELYGHWPVSNSLSNPKVEELTKVIDIDWLSNKSTSFGHFAECMRKFLSTFQTNI